MNRYDTVIFDLDGTLLNTLEDLTDSVNYSLKLNGFPERTLNEVRSFIGNSDTRLMELAIPGGLGNSSFEKCLTDYRSHYATNLQNKTKPYENVETLLINLKENGFRLAIVSNKRDPSVKELNSRWFKPYIPVALGVSDEIPKKPDPTLLNNALNELQSKQEKTIFVGDSEVDVRTAANAGIQFIGVTWGFRDTEILKQAGADILINKPEELTNYLIIL